MTQREVTEAQPVPRCARGHHARHMLNTRLRIRVPML